MDFVVVVIDSDRDNFDTFLRFNTQQSVVVHTPERRFVKVRAREPRNDVRRSCFSTV